jgi:hypothetical protein
VGLFEVAMHPLRVALPVLLALGAPPARAVPPPGQSALLDGMHDIESGTWMAASASGCDRGWITDLQYIGTGGTPGASCHDAETNQGLSIIQRLDAGGSESFPLDPAQAEGYATAFASFASQCPRLHVWIVGNEPNFTANDSDPAKYASPYAESYARVSTKLHAVPGHQNDVVLLNPASPYSPFCICSLHKIVQEIVKRGVTPDGFALHAYTQAQHPSDFGSLVGLVTTDTMSQSNDGCGYPFHWHFRIYRDFVKAIEDEGLGGRPTFITESGNACAPQQGNACYPDQDLGYFDALYQEIADWNADPSHPTKIRAITPYRWTGNDDGTGRDFEIGKRSKLLQDLSRAFGKKHQWTDQTPDCQPLPDAGPAIDAGVTPDAGPDAGPQPDAGVAIDAGTTPDAGPVPDAGARPDGSAPKPSAPNAVGGCGCGGGASGAALAFIAFAALRRRRAAPGIPLLPVRKNSLR